jgi:4-hydroxy-3-polyprenylbenzoate decarboxylase
MEKLKLVVAITGASGSIYAKQLLHSLEELTEQIQNLDIVITPNAHQVSKVELNEEIYIPSFARVFKRTDFNAPFASGSAGYHALLVVPCSMGTLARIANGISDELITRTADVMLKERKKLILVTRETPLNLIHIQNMEKITLAGGIICPASPSFYNKPQSVQEIIKTVTDRALTLAGLKINTFKWGS